MRTVAEGVVEFFYGLKGFDDWWDDIDEDIQDQIIDDLAEELE